MSLSEETCEMRLVRPISPASGYIGGKRLLAKQLIPRIEAIPHEVYAEPFIGMGGVFLRRSRIPEVEAINDANKDVATFFRILQRHYQPFLDMLRWQLSSRSEFERLMKIDPGTLTDLERAARFLYLQRLSFGGKVAGRTFGYAVSHEAKFNLYKIEPLLEAIHERLGGVYIDCLDFADFIKRWDRPFTLFYLDPPYWGCESYYVRELFTKSDFERLSDTLKTLRGRFILSLNDVPAVRDLFAWAKIESVTLNYSVHKGEGKQAKEVIISSP